MLRSVSARGTRRRRGFTLIELLVVVTIISVLAAMLLPVLQSVLETAKAMTCVNNQRQLATAFLLYQGEHNGFLPPNCISSAGTIANVWIEPTLPYLSFNYDYVASGGWLPPAISSLFHCPRRDKALTNYRWWESDYGVNSTYNLFGRDGAPNRPADRFSAPCTPATLMFLMDAGQRSVTSTSWTATAIGADFQRHRGGSNVTYFDSHSGSLPAWGLIQVVSDAPAQAAFFNWR